MNPPDFILFSFHLRSLLIMHTHELSNSPAAMWKLRPLFSLLFFLLICSSPAFVSAAQRSTSLWQTLSGDQPLVIAHGGFSGLFPASSSNAYALALDLSLPTVLSWCDVQLTKDGNGICFPDLLLNNASDVSDVFNNKGISTYLVNGVDTKGYFTVDFTLKDLQNVLLTQGIYSRPLNFDYTSQILTVDDVVTQFNKSHLWLNVQHDAFFSQHNLSMRSFVISVSRRVIISYISSTEVNFLKGIAARFKAPSTKLIFQFLGQNDIEPTTNQSYGSLLKNLTFIKTFANGILVPKYYIWPVDMQLYLLPHTSVVSDAHAQGLEVYASEFATDVPFAYNYSYDPVSEYLSYIDNGNFSVDGLVSDFPLTPSATVDCFSHMGKNETEQVKFLIISSEGSSGQYPGCTDLAYKQAIEDGADVIDCPVQMSQDAVAFCMGSINLIERTTAPQTFTNFTWSIPGIVDGIFPFNLTWSQIQTLKPSMYNPYTKYPLYRNPKNKSDGNFLTLSDFLAMAKNESSVSGILISIEHAAFLAQNVGLDVISAVVGALNSSGYNNQTRQKVYIQSGDSAVLAKFREANNYELVYNINEAVSDVTNSTIKEITKFASAVVLTKNSVYPKDQGFLTIETNVVPKFQAFNVSTYVKRFDNEFVSPAFDFLLDPYVEINTFVSGMVINGVVTGFPATSARFRKNRCLGYKELPAYMSPVQPGGLLKIMPNDSLPPAEAPSPVLTEGNVAEAPLPSVRAPPTSGNGSGTTTPGPTTPPSGQCIVVANTFLGSLAIILVTFAVLMS